ncbi:hypothetical protein PYX06_02615 [Citrobacter amalonaticus]|nr:hypothetical protein [Citrobacter amalonaticus]
MQNPFSTVALLAMGVAFQCGAEVPVQPQHNAQEHVSEDSGIVRFHGSVFASPLCADDARAHSGCRDG